MDRVEIKDRLGKVGDRVLVMVRKYPFVFLVLVLISGVVGFVLGKVF